MANGEIYEKNLSNASGIGSGDYLRTVNSNNESEKINYTLLAKAIIEQWVGSTLAGSAQTVKSAIDALNSKLVVPSSVDVLDFAENIPGSNVTDCAIRFCVTDSTSANVPANGFCIVMSRAARRMVLLITIGGSIYTNSYDGSTWAGWKQATMS